MHMCIQHMCIKTSIFFRSECIDPSTNCVKCFSNLTCGTFLCSFEKHMLQKVRYAILAVCSFLEPVNTQIPTATERTVDTGSSTTLNPFLYVCVCIMVFLL